MVREQREAGGEPGQESTTLGDVVRRRAGDHPERIACTFVRDGDEDEIVVRYGELDAWARAVAAKLDRLAPAAVTAMLVFDPGPEFVAALLGCLYAGVIAVPVLPPDPRDPAGSGERIRRVGDDARTGIVLTTGTVGARLDACRADGAPRVAIDGLASSDAPGWEPHRRSDVALLQYTSGSTGTPRGVIVTHANLLAHGRRVARALRLDTDAVAVSWLPVCHDMGLVGTLLIPLQIGFRTVQMSPVHFLERPVRWLRAITRHRGTLSPAPNFAYDLVARKTSAEDRRSLALDSWRAALNGAEPIRAETCERFVATFAGCGFRREAFVPCYGLAEATLMVAGGPLGAGPVQRTVGGPALDAGVAVPCDVGDSGARTIVASGAPLEDLAVWIADTESGRLLADGRVGEIRMSGETVAAGYWERPVDTERTFPSGSGENGRTLRTGDLGFLADGLLFVTGRSKDLIIVRGRNHHPHDLEATAGGAHASLRLGGGAAFAVDGEKGEQVVVVHETDADDPATLAAAASAIRAAIVHAHGITLAAVVLIPPRTLPKTTSGKVRRMPCRALFAAGRLPTRFDDRATARRATRDACVDADAIEKALREVVAALRDVPPATVSRDAALATLGIDSAEAAEVAATLEAKLGRRVPLAVLMEQPTIAGVAAALLEVPS